jgi:glycogen debranching enzyme
VRHFWRSDGTIGALATRLAGSSDLFGEDCRSVNFLAAHDGFTLADTVAYAERHNHANGEDNRDGQGENFSWNNGAEGPSTDPAVLAARAVDLRALLDTLFASTGTIMLTAGDEFGRSQHGNNNSYAQDNPSTWIDWEHRDRALEHHVAELSCSRTVRRSWLVAFPQPGIWHKPDRHSISAEDWENALTDGLTYTPAADKVHGTLRISRSGRLITWDFTG